MYKTEQKRIATMRNYLNKSLYQFQREADDLGDDWVIRQKKAADLCERFIAPLNHFLNRHDTSSFFNDMNALSDKLSQEKYNESLTSDEREQAHNLYDESRDICSYMLQVSGKMAELIMPVICSRP